MTVIYALVVVILNNITLIDVLPTKSLCEYYAQKKPGSICVPVTVENPEEVQKQLQAINTLVPLTK